MACAAVMTASGQSTTWNGHSYEVVWYKDVTGIEPDDVTHGWWGDLNPREHSASVGGHVLTITSQEEEDAIRELWSRTAVLPSTYVGLALITVDRSVIPHVISWDTGEVSTFYHEIFEANLDVHELSLNARAINPPEIQMVVSGNNQAYRDPKPFYILEIDPPIGPVDTDGDGLTDDQEKNTRHSYSFVQSDDPWEPGQQGGGWTRDEAIADAITRGGHLVEVTDQQELVAIMDILYPWYVFIASNFLNVTPTAHPATCIRSSSGEKMHYFSSDCAQRYNTYILEIEDSTDPNNPDTDADGLTDGQEVLTTLTDPLNADSDGDQLFDGIEINTTKTNPLAADSDADGLDDYVEVATHRTNPLLADTDGDGFDDKLEVDKGTDPLSPGSLPVVQLSVYPAIEIEFPTKAGESYQLEVSSNLQTWAPFGDVFVGTGQPYARFIAAREQASFLRAVIVR